MLILSPLPPSLPSYQWAKVTRVLGHQDWQMPQEQMQLQHWSPVVSGL